MGKKLDRHVNAHENIFHLDYAEKMGSRVVYRTLFTSGETKRNVLKEEVTKNVEFGVEK